MELGTSTLKLEQANKLKMSMHFIIIYYGLLYPLFFFNAVLKVVQS